MSDQLVTAAEVRLIELYELPHPSLAPIIISLIQEGVDEATAAELIVRIFYEALAVQQDLRQLLEAQA